MNYLIIPSASLAPKSIGQLYNVPMVLYPVNGEPIIDLILKQYHSGWKSVISSYHGYETLMQNQSVSKKSQIVKIDAMKNVGYTICNTLEKIALTDNDRLIINFADTVVDNNDLTSNCIVVKTSNTINEKWTYLLQEKGQIKTIIDKTAEHSFAEGEALLVCGVFSIKKPKTFLNFLRAEENRLGCNLYKALKSYSKLYPFDFVEAQNWLDIGHPDEYFDSKMAIKSRQFNHISFDKDRGIIAKRSDNSVKLSSEIEWFLKLPKELQYVTPRIFDYSLDVNDVFIKMEYYQYPTLLELSLYGDLNEESWRKVFSKIDFVLSDFSLHKKTDGPINEALKDIYLTKTISRLKEMKENHLFVSFFNNPITINGTRYLSLDRIMELLPKVVEKYLLNISEFNVIHGDLCFSNILIDDKLNFIKLIDPRGSFGEFDIYGDQRYELAKLFHSIDGKYDYIIKDHFNVTFDDASINYQVEKPRIDLYPIAKEALKGQIGSRINEIEIIEALLFLSMIPLHKECVNHQMAMLATGITILDRWVDIKGE